MEAERSQFKFTDRAIVYWKPRGTFVPLCRQFFRYSRADALSGTHGILHLRWATKYLVFVILMILGFTSKPMVLVAAGFLLVAYGFYPWVAGSRGGPFLCPGPSKLSSMQSASQAL